MKALLTAIALATLASAPALAADEGFYVGAGIGNFNLDSDRIYAGRDFDGSDFGFKVLAGYQFIPWLAVEGEYIDGGEPDDNYRDPSFPDDRLKMSVRVSGFVGSAVGILPIGDNFNLFAKAGVIYWDGDGSAKIRNEDGTLAKTSYGDDGTDFAWAVGGTWYIFENLAVRGEYQGFEISNFNSFDFASASVIWQF